MIGTTEDNLIALVKAEFGSKLRLVDSLPGDWSDDMLKSLIISAPAVYLAFLGGPKITNSDTIVGIDSRWSFFAITAHASGQKARRRGDSLQIGAYEIISRLIPVVHNHTVPDIGTITLVSIDDLFNGNIDSKGVSLWAALFTMPMYFDPSTNLGSLDDFETFHADWDIAGLGGEIRPETEIQLPID
jgi:phage gp37-like protein